MKLEDILKGINTTDIDGCHPIEVGRLDRHGYMICDYNHKMQFIHRILAEYYNIEGEGAIVRHLCNNKICGNPKHLRYGNHKENMKDFIDSGEFVYVPRKMNNDSVKEMRRLYKEEGYGKLRLSRIFNMSERQTRDILNNKYWKDDSYTPHHIFQGYGGQT